MWYFLVRGGGGEEEDWFWCLTGGGHSIYSSGQGHSAKKGKKQVELFHLLDLSSGGKPQVEGGTIK